tara:strand:+ start:31 stop:516 length:486 start_codon:yes stop_codon:yes gene_type:complete
MDFKEMIERLMRQNMQQQAPNAAMQHQQMQAEQARNEAMQQQMQRRGLGQLSDMDVQRIQQMQQNRLRQVPPEQMQMLHQQLPQSAPAASPEMMMERGGMGALPNALMERLQQMQPQLQDELQTGASGWLPLREQHIRMKPQKPRLETHPELFGLGFGVQR